MPPKRKAKDAASPTRQPGPRARSTRISKASPATDGNESDALPARPGKRARKTTSRPAKQDDDLDDDFGGYGGRGSSKPATIEQHLMEQNKKSKEFIQGFKEQVAQGRAHAHSALAKLKQDLAKSHDPGNDNNLADVYATLQTAAQTRSTKDNPLFEQTQQLLRLSRAILSCHQTADRDSRTQEVVSPRETWKQDEEGMRMLLGYGKVFGERVVEGWITPHDDKVGGGDGEEDGESGGEEDKESLSEAENLARGLFEWRRKGGALLKGEESWGVAARRQMVALAGVVRTLPSKEG
ncbi:6d24efdd-47e8-48fc-a4f6-c9a3cf6d6fdb [Parachaetomium inaequale]|uniref:6d24efdd-47e8-48fc-a4f6-c9a3cf6d6fdb n=1 Tax=Parachaetomium inaequale TaxID=2588326 RepID=A0AAN6PBY2_9PEZI|nr:6d24efdd-47e8-48fc-a4f6-c9a3cf6d6fdb [Parachaetomium inaequale]